MGKVLGGYRIPRGTLMCFNMSAVHHLNGIFGEGEGGEGVFDPRRFLESAPAFTGQSDSDSECAVQKASTLVNHIAPFGLGLRQCPARHFTMWELRTVLTLLLSKYEWRLPEKSVHRERVINGFSFGSNLNRPKELGMRFWKREK